MESRQLDIDVNGAIEQMGSAVQQRLAELEVENPLIVGIHTGGLWVAEKIHQHLNVKKPLAELDISFYRDDFTRIGLNPQVKPSRLPHSLEDETIVLVDDVLFTGRTVRAALNELFDYGRPKRVILAVLVDRGGRELPFQADIVGVKLDLLPEKQVKLSGPAPLALETNRV